MEVLLDRDEVAKMIEEVTNEAIEKRMHKAIIQKALIYELNMLEPVDSRDNDDNIELALQGLKLFLHNWCMNVKKTKEKKEPCFRCKECKFRFNEKWDNDDNIDYLIAEYGIDLRELFQAEVETQSR